MSSSAPLRRCLPALAAAGALLLATQTGCSGGDSPGTPSGDEVIAAQQAAPDSAIPAGSTMDRIRKSGELRVGGSLDAPLWSQQDPATGQTSGFDADMGKLLAKYIIGKPNVKIVNSATETREALLANGTADVVLQTYTITPKRAQQVAFAGPYFSSGLAIAVKKGTKGISKPADLNGRTVIAGANTPAIPALQQQAPTAKVITFGTGPECLTALQQGRGEAYVQDQALLLADAKVNSDVTLVGEPFTSDPYGIGLKHGDEQFKTFVNDWLRQIQANGAWQKVWKRTIGTAVEGDAPAPPAIGSVPGS